MVYKYSRRAITEEKRNLRKAAIFGVLTLAFLIIFYFFGLPFIIKFAAFLTDLNSSSKPVEIGDNTPPPPPRFDTFPLFTNEKRLELKGNTEPGVSVVLSVNGDVEKILSNSEGAFSYTFDLVGGENKFSAFSVDDAGNESKKTDLYKIVFDKEPPGLTIVKPDDGTQFFGATERQIVIEGTTDEDTSVSINGRFVVVESDGSFSFATSLNDGENLFEVKAEDKAGNVREESFKVTFTP